MKPDYDLAIVIPVGPNSDRTFISDTLQSLACYLTCSYKIIISDDSHQGIGEDLKKNYPAADTIFTTKPMGGWAGLYISLAEAFRHAIDNYRFKALLKLDTDALIIGFAPEVIAFDLFKRFPNIGLAGQYPKDYHGNMWNTTWPRDRILNGTTTWKYIKRPVANWFLRKQYRRAIRNGYKAGESVFGGAYFFNPVCLARLQTEGLLPRRQFQTLNLGEDHLFSMLVKATGFDLGDLCSGKLPFACAWKGLPASPEELYYTGKKIIHSTRYWKDMNETAIREWFQKKRNTDSMTVPSAKQETK